MNKLFFPQVARPTRPIYFPLFAGQSFFIKKIVCPQESNGQTLMQIMDIIEKPKFCSLKPVGRKSQRHLSTHSECVIHQTKIYKLVSASKM